MKTYQKYEHCLAAPLITLTTQNLLLSSRKPLGENCEHFNFIVFYSFFLDYRAMARVTLLLVPIFGATWLFGVLAINKETLFFKYIFTILNSIQVS